MKAIAEKNKQPKYHLRLLEPMQQSSLESANDRMVSGIKTQCI